jgi:hypothetical protein
MVIVWSLLHQALGDSIEERGKRLYHSLEMYLAVSDSFVVDVQDATAPAQRGTLVEPEFAADLTTRSRPEPLCYFAYFVVGRRAVVVGA